MKRIVLVGLIIAYSVRIVGIYDPIEEAINDGEPSKLQRLFIPHFILCLDDKSKYVKLACDNTNKTYGEMQKQFTLSDSVRLLKGSFKLVLGAAAALMSRQFFKAGTFSVAHTVSSEVPAAEGAESTAPTTVTILENHTYGSLIVKWLLASIGAVTCCSGIKDLYASLTRYDRILKHNKALAIEAIINRLSVCVPQQSQAVMRNPLEVQQEGTCANVDSQKFAN